MKHLDVFVEVLLRLATLGAFAMSVWAITYATVGYAMYYVLTAIFLQLRAMAVRNEKT